jgi:hypothetical protein
MLNCAHYLLLDPSPCLVKRMLIEGGGIRDLPASVRSSSCRQSTMANDLRLVAKSISSKRSILLSGRGRSRTPRGSHGKIDSGPEVQPWIPGRNFIAGHPDHECRFDRARVITNAL